VTIIVGIKCKDAIVLGSDSQLTYGNSKRLDGTKIETVLFGSLPVLVAQAGCVIMSGRAVDILTALVRQYAPQTPDDVALMAQKAMRDLRLDQQQLYGCSAEELDEIFRKQGVEAEIMLGFFMNETAHIYTVSLAKALYFKSKSYYEAIGCGAPLGMFLLSENASPDMEVRLASLIAIYAIEIVKRNDAFCGGPTKIGIIKKPVPEKHSGLPVTHVFFQDHIDRAATQLMEADKVTKEARTKILHEQILSKGFKDFPVEWLDIL
jgi:ATP-dependent protease HslVU (ClpYQ) peptidase subunit